MREAPYQPLKVYVAGPWEKRDVCMRLKEILEACGAICTSTWLMPIDELSMDALNKNDFHEKRKRALQDEIDIRACNVFVKVKPKEWHRMPNTGGHQCETGMVIILGKPALLYGDRENVFDYHPLVRTVETLADLVEALEIRTSYVLRGQPQVAGEYRAPDLLKMS